MKINSSNKNLSEKKIVAKILVNIIILLVFVLELKSTITPPIKDINQIKNKLTNKINIINKTLKKVGNSNINITNITNLISKEDKKLRIKIQNQINEYLKNQKLFCHYQSLFYKEKFEKTIKKVDINFKTKTYKNNTYNKSFNMYVYISSDYVSNEIMNLKSWESECSGNLLDALDYYANKNNIKNNDIYILDIGANIGWYSILFGKYGFNVLAFEPSKINAYILKKNYCLNKDINTYIINKGLYTEEKICDIYNLIGNIGNGMVICDTNIRRPSFLFSKRTGEIFLTRLSNYIPFLIGKNLALIKIDIEGSEGKALESGIELITKYHIPFIFLEFTKDSLSLHGTNPIQFLNLFLDNGYQISINNFLDKTYTTIENIMKFNLINLYIVYTKILEE